VGTAALGANTTGHSNTSVGKASLLTNTTGESSVAIGYSALNKNTTAGNNVAVGWKALEANTVGFENTGLGNQAGDEITTGDQNTAAGSNALGKVTTGDGNTGLGRAAGDLTTTGGNNISIGLNSDPTANDVSNQITLGNGDNDNLRCADTSISTLSDERDKENIENIPHGLDYILAIRPVKFDWKTRDGSREGKKDYGFIAQELAKVEEKFESAEYTRLVHKENPEKWEADVMKTYPILIKAIQELSETNKKLTSRIEELEKK